MMRAGAVEAGLVGLKVGQAVEPHAKVSLEQNSEDLRIRLCTAWHPAGGVIGVSSTWYKNGKGLPLAKMADYELARITSYRAFIGRSM
jgi:hypothetical protein